MKLAFVILLFCGTATGCDDPGHGSKKAAIGYHWGYKGGETGPSGWSAHYENCGKKKQSPINLDDASTTKVTLQPFRLKQFNRVAAGTKFTLLNNGHSLQVNILPNDISDYTTSGGGLSGTYIPLQFHFHWGSKNSRGSEHTVNGGRYPMEMHIVHRNNKYSSTTDALKDSKGLAVLGVFFRVSKRKNPTIQRLINSFSEVKNAGSSTSITPFPLGKLLPRSIRSSFFRYMGSLTTPTCNQAVVWTLFGKTIPISSGQLKQFRSLLNDGEKIQDNFRPIQNTNGRNVYWYQ